MIFMHNLEINNNRSIVKLALYCIKIAFEKNIFQVQYAWNQS